MTTTHAAIGLVLAVGVTRVEPTVGTLVALAAYAGSTFPDLDVLVGEHRRTLHYPIGYWGLAVPATVVAVAVPGPFTVGGAAFLAGAALHASMDVFGGGLGPKPWIEDDDRGVYDHFHDRWVPPLRVVRWDGAPEDLLLAVVLSVPPFLVFDGVVQALTGVGVLASVGYTLIRRRLPDLVPNLFT